VIGVDPHKRSHTAVVLDEDEEIAAQEVHLEVAEPVTQRRVLDALEAAYPTLRGTVRDPATQRRRPFVRFFVGEQDLSHEPPEAALPAGVGTGVLTFHIVGRWWAADHTSVGRACPGPGGPASGPGRSSPPGAST
jgi:sulfur-carrier protein